MPMREKKKYSVNFDNYKLISLDGEISLANEMGLKVNLPLSDIGDRIAEMIRSDHYFYYKIIPVSKYYEIITYRLIDNIIEVGGFYGDLLEACYLKDKKKGEDIYLPYAFNKIFTKRIKIYDPISDEALQKLIEKYDWEFIRIYEVIRGIFRVSREKAYKKVIEELDSSKELDLFRIFVIYSVNRSEAKKIIEESVITPNIKYDYEHVIPRWELQYADEDILHMLNDLGIKVHKDSLNYNEVRNFIEKIDKNKIIIIEN
ncbi:MAG: hypothetical protein QXQ01_04830 [Saccharolobus sp.]